MSRERGVVSASIIRGIPTRKPDSADVPVYRVGIVGNPPTSVGEMQLTWSPQPQTERMMSALVDGKAPVEYRIEGKQSMGNGMKLQSGHASVLLSNGKGGNLHCRIDP